MDEKVLVVSKLLRSLKEEQGSVILVKDLKDLASQEGVSGEEVEHALQRLSEDGFIKRIDEDSVQFW